MVLEYLYKNWSQAGILIGLYMTLLLACMAPVLDPFILLVWLQFPVYLVHEFEEHTIGCFRDWVNTKVFRVSNAQVPLNDKRVFWLNIIAVWMLLPASAVAAQFINPAFGFLGMAFSLCNATTHIIAAIVKRAYNPGLVASIFLNYPAGLYALFLARQHGYCVTYFWYAIAFGIFIHVVIASYAFYWYRQFKRTAS